MEIEIQRRVRLLAQKAESGNGNTRTIMAAPGANELTGCDFATIALTP